MFDFSFGELTIIGAVALVVLGPERLPKVARTIGQWIGKAQRYVADVKADIQRETELAELKKLQQQVQASARELETSVQQSLTSIESEFKSAAAQLNDDSSPSSHGSQSGGAASYDSPSYDDFIKPPPSTDELAAKIESLERQLALTHASAPRFKYAPRARAMHTRRARRYSSH
ncbi:MAG TPA: Sec-independent protein translocase protein TatB [Burkholderiaceae bacterium]|nr:Sec-independent protein translocase protein TatB [Burkholderiaceae bacterium]